MTDDKAKIEMRQRLKAAEAYLEHFAGNTRHKKLVGAMEALLLASGPPVDHACAIFAVHATALSQGRRVDVHVMSEGQTDVHGGDRTLQQFSVRKDGDDSDPEPGSPVH